MTYIHHSLNLGPPHKALSWSLKAV